MSAESEKSSLHRMHPWPLVKPAGRGGRFFALLFDTVLVVLFVCFFGFAIGACLYWLNEPENGLAWLLDHHKILVGLGIFWCIVFVVVIWAYIVLFRSLFGQTPGENLFGLFLVRDDGRRPGVGDVMLRGLAALVSMAPVGAGYLWSLFNRQRQTWHDLLSSTRKADFWP